MKSRTKIKTIFRISGVLLALLMLAAIAVPVSAQNAGKTVEDYWLTAVELKAVYTATAPTVDGNADDPAWENAFTLFYDPNSEATKAVLNEYGGVCKDDTKAWPEGESATLKFLWDDEALYILDSRVDKHVYYGTPATQGGASKAFPWQNAEGAIFAIQPLESLCENEADGDIWQFYTTLADAEAQANGAVQLRMTYPSLSTKSYVPLPEGVRCAASLTETGWQMELAIPWSCIQSRYKIFSPEAGYKMSFRISVGNYLPNGKTYFYGYTDAYHRFQLANADFGGYPVLALADASGNVPDYDLSIPTTLGPEPNPGGEDTGETNPPDTDSPHTNNEPPVTKPADTGEVPSGTPAKKKNPALAIVLSVVMILAVAAAVVVIIKLKKQIVRIVAAVLAVLIAAGCITGIVLSVRSVPSEPGNHTPSTSGTRPEETIPQSKVPAGLTFKGDEVKVLVRKGLADEFDPEYTGALIDNAVYTRNESVQDRLQLKVTYVRNEGNTTDYLAAVRNSIFGGPYYDIITSYAYYGAGLAAEHLYYDMNSGEEKNYISSGSPWYNQSFVNECSINGILNFVVGDLTLSATDRTVVTFFNETILADYNTEYSNGALDLYEVAINGGWTLEYVQTLIRDVYRDMDFDGKKSAGDLYGLVFNNGSMCVDAMLMAVGIPLTEKTDDGGVQLAFQKSSCLNAYQALYHFIYESEGLFAGTPANGNYYGDITTYFSDQAFYNGQAMFSFGMLESVKTFATDTTLHYGILPLPKYNETQKNYATTPQDAYSIISIPYNIGSRLEITTATLEMLSWYSYRDVRPIYYENAYKVRYASSDTTAKLFDMIIDTISYDFGSLYGASIDNPLHRLRNQLAGYNQTASYNLGGLYRVYGGAMEEKLQELLKSFEPTAQE